MILFLGLAVCVGAFLSTNRLESVAADNTAQESDSRPSPSVQVEEPAPEAAGESVASGVLSPIFTGEVTHWEPQILAWSSAHGVDPDITAILMQIESCGDPQALSPAGARGLFQVMPFHFAAGEDTFHPDTNAARGLSYFKERLIQTNGDVGRAFAGYNGGHVAAASSWDSWAAETQSYYIWGTGLYKDAKSGLSESPTLERWLSAGGASHCRQAAGRLGL
jgi:soluble lytic murein transglycosylase-like protein